MTPRFAPKGERSEWRMIYDDLLATADIGDVISYADIERVIGRDLKGNRSPFYHARTYLGEARHRWTESVPNKGYRVIEASEHVRVSIDHKRKSRRQLNMAMKVLGSTDLALLTPEELAKWDDQQKINFALWGVLAHENELRRIKDVLRREGLL